MKRKIIGTILLLPLLLVLGVIFALSILAPGEPISLVIIVIALGIIGIRMILTDK